MKTTTVIGTWEMDAFFNAVHLLNEVGISDEDFPEAMETLCKSFEESKAKQQERNND